MPQSNYKKSIRTISMTETASQALTGLGERYRLALPAPVKAPGNAAIIFYAGFKGITSQGDYSLYLEVVNAFALYFLFTGDLDKPRFTGSVIYKDLVKDIQHQSPTLYDSYLSAIDKIPEQNKPVAKALLSAGDYNRLKPYLCDLILEDLTSAEVIAQAESARKILFAPGVVLYGQEEEDQREIIG